MVHVQGRIVDASTVPVAGARVYASGVLQEVGADGDFTFPLDSAATVLLRIEAPGFYTIVQTVHRTDFVAGREARLPAVELVRKKPGRSLILFAGDSMLARRYFEPRAGEPALVRRERVLDDGMQLLQHVRPYIELADYASVNLETQLSSEPLGNRLPKSVTFYSPVELAALLQWAGFDYVALGNNHMYDYREAGLRSTLAALEGSGLDYSGGGHGETEARAPAYREINGRMHAFLSYVGWAGTFSPNQVAEATKGGAALGDRQTIVADLGMQSQDAVSVVQLHAGLEYAANPALSERTLLREAVVGGADIAIGHHAHVLQGFEIYDNRLIAYSMGNFLFDQYHYTTQLGMLLYVWMDGDTLHRAEAVPLHINGYVPTPATGLFRHAVLTRLARLSDPQVCMRQSGFHAVVEACNGRERAANTIVVPDSVGATPVHVRSLGASPLLPVVVQSGGRRYRLGIDLSRRGDFEYAGLFATHDRTWMLGSNAQLRISDNNHMQVRLPQGGATVRTGMKVFERVFTSSNPATVSGRIKVDGNATVRLLLQRRRMTEILEDELDNGPLEEIGTWEGSSPHWTDFSFDYRQPRIATRSVRLLIDIVDNSEEKAGATVSLDDLAWVEWQTPWMAPDDDNVAPEFATHLMLHPTSKP